MPEIHDCHHDYVSLLRSVINLVSLVCFFVIFYKLVVYFMSWWYLLWVGGIFGWFGGIFGVFLVSVFGLVVCLLN